MKITFVMGIPGAGKSTYIKEHFKDRKILDLWDFQTHAISYDEVWKSYLDIQKELIEAIKNDEDVVMEHTLLKGIRRKMYIDSVKEVTDCPIECIIINPPRIELSKRRTERFGDDCDETLNMYYDALEIPTVEEGFSKITIIED